MLLQEFWNDRFWPHCTRNLRESTRVGYESAWRLHVMPVFGGMDMGAISVELVDKWLAGFDSAGAARKAWAVLRAILRRAIRWNLLDVDITRRDIQLPSKPHYEPTLLTDFWRVSPVFQCRVCTPSHIVDYSIICYHYRHESESTNSESPSCGVQCVPRLGLLWESYVDS